MDLVGLLINEWNRGNKENEISQQVAGETGPVIETVGGKRARRVDKPAFERERQRETRDWEGVQAAG